MLNHMPSMSLRHRVRRHRHATSVNQAGKKTKAERKTYSSHTLILCLFEEFGVLNNISIKSQYEKPPEGGFGIAWWPGAESIWAEDVYPSAILPSSHNFIEGHSLSMMLNLAEFLMRPLGIMRSLRTMPSCFAPILIIAFLEF